MQNVGTTFEEIKIHNESEDADSPFIDLTKCTLKKVECALVYVEGDGLVLLTPNLCSTVGPAAESLVVFSALLIMLNEHPEYAVEISAWLENCSPEQIRKYVNLPHLPIQDNDY